MGGQAGDAETAGEGGAEPSARRAGRAVPAARATITACYVLAGYEPDPCLAPDDSLVAWFDELPAGCEPRVTTGPFAQSDRSGRRCCYGVECSATPRLESSAEPFAAP